jgi:hypothetical protein
VIPQKIFADLKSETVIILFSSNWLKTGKFLPWTAQWWWLVINEIYVPPSVLAYSQHFLSVSSDTNVIQRFLLNWNLPRLRYQTWKLCHISGTAFHFFDMYPPNLQRVHPPVILYHSSHSSSRSDEERDWRTGYKKESIMMKIGYVHRLNSFKCTRVEFRGFHRKGLCAFQHVSEAQ